MQRDRTLPVFHLVGILTLGLLGSLALACHGASTPSDSQVREIFTELFKDEYLADGRAELSSFRKTDGVPEGEFYEYDYEATLTCLKDYNFGYGPKPDGHCYPGKVITLTGRLVLQRTEKGWRRSV